LRQREMPRDDAGTGEAAAAQSLCSTEKADIDESPLRHSALGYGGETIRPWDLSRIDRQRPRSENNSCS